MRKTSEVWKRCEQLLEEELSKLPYRPSPALPLAEEARQIVEGVRNGFRAGGVAAPRGKPNEHQSAFEKLQAGVVFCAREIGVQGMEERRIGSPYSGGSRTPSQSSQGYDYAGGSVRTALANAGNHR